MIVDQPEAGGNIEYRYAQVNNCLSGKNYNILLTDPTGSHGAAGGAQIHFFIDELNTTNSTIFINGMTNINYSSHYNISIDLSTQPIISDEYPLDDIINLERPPVNLSANIEDPNDDTMNIQIRWKNHNNQWVTLQTYSNEINGRFNYIPSGNDWLWGETTYTWSVNATDGTYWTNKSFSFTTGGSRYDVSNNDVVNFQDAGVCWVHRDTVAPYDGLYDVNHNGVVNFQDAGLCWINRD